MEDKRRQTCHDVFNSLYSYFYNKTNLAELIDVTIGLVYDGEGVISDYYSRPVKSVGTNWYYLIRINRNKKLLYVYKLDNNYINRENLIKTLSYD